MDFVSSKLAEHGLLGLVIVVQMAVIIRLFNLLQASWESRNTEGKASQTMQHDILESVRGLTEVIRDLRRDAVK